MCFIHRNTNTLYTNDFYKIFYSSTGKIKEAKQINVNSRSPGICLSLSMRNDMVGAKAQCVVHLWEYGVRAAILLSFSLDIPLPLKKTTVGWTYKMGMWLGFICMTWKFPCWWSIPAEWWKQLQSSTHNNNKKRGAAP